MHSYCHVTHYRQRLLDDDDDDDDGGADGGGDDSGEGRTFNKLLVLVGARML